MPDPRELLDRLESRHDELIRKLDELNSQIEAALAQFGKSRSETPAHEAATESRSTDSAAKRRAA